MKWFSSSSCYACAAVGAIAIKRHLADALAVAADAAAAGFGWDGFVSESVSGTAAGGCSCKLLWGDERSVIDLLFQQFASLRLLAWPGLVASSLLANLSSCLISIYELAVAD